MVDRAEPWRLQRSELQCSDSETIYNEVIYSVAIAKQFYVSEANHQREAINVSKASSKHEHSEFKII